MEAGLVNKVVVADEDLETETLALANTVADKLPAAIALGKQAFYQQLEQPSVAAAYEYTSAVMVKNMLLAATADKISNFLQKKF